MLEFRWMETQSSSDYVRVAGLPCKLQYRLLFADGNAGEWSDVCIERMPAPRYDWHPTADEQRKFDEFFDTLEGRKTP